jgi:hypothetical protein
VRERQRRREERRVARLAAACVSGRRRAEEQLHRHAGDASEEDPLRGGAVPAEGLVREPAQQSIAHGVIDGRRGVRPRDKPGRQRAYEEHMERRELDHWPVRVRVRVGCRPGRGLSVLCRVPEAGCSRFVRQDADEGCAVRRAEALGQGRVIDLKSNGILAWANVR